MSIPHLDLRQRLRGPVLTRGEPGYGDACRLWNAMAERRPEVIARCLGTADVQVCLRHARAHGLPVSIKGGGHHIAGLAVADRGLVVDMSLQRGVWVDPTRRVARAQAGCLLGDVDSETQQHGLATVLGFVSTTGIAGLTLGGGFGYLTRRFGWTVDNVLAMDVVCADGRLVRASEDEHADLFWALRGGGGNFGVVTGFEYRLHPVGPEIMAGAIAWPIEEAPRVLEMVRSEVEAGPPELVCAPILRRAPRAAWIPRPVHDQPVIVLVVCDSGPLPDAERRVARIKRFGTPVADVVQRRPYCSQQSLLDATQPRGSRYYWKSEFAPALSAALCADALEQAVQPVSIGASILMFPVGGAIQRHPRDHTAMGNRDAHWVVNVMAGWNAPEGDAPNVAWVRDTWQALRRHSTGGTYVNFLTEDEGEDRVRSAYRTNWNRLFDAKTAWDPDNVLRHNRNIEPRAKG